MSQKKEYYLWTAASRSHEKNDRAGRRVRTSTRSSRTLALGATRTRERTEKKRGTSSNDDPCGAKKSRSETRAWSDLEDYASVGKLRKNVLNLGSEPKTEKTEKQRRSVPARRQQDPLQGPVRNRRLRMDANF